MCLLAFAYKQHPTYKLIMASNRDEQKARPSAAAFKWDTDPFLIAGKDLEKGGTWLGINEHGRFAAVTNYRQPTLVEENKLSRGLMMTDYLLGSNDPASFLKTLSSKAVEYNAFNLIAGDINDVYYYSNIEFQLMKLEPGIYGLSNALLDTPWPKVEYIKFALADSIREPEIDTNKLFDILKNEKVYPDHLLPHTGVAPELEKLLSSAFINTSFYGTRSSNVMTISYDNEVVFIDRVYQDNEAQPYVENKFQFSVKR
jgi:uncharacterized protein with NRDE domain